MAPGRRKDTVTLSEVAKAAGVSLATASKALNGRSQVKEETRRRVETAAASLSFTPNPFAKALNSNRTETIGMLTNDLDSRFVLPVLRGAEDAFGAGSTSVLLCDARGDVEREQHHIRTLLAKRVDGIVILGRSTNSRESITSDIPVPVVYAYAPSARTDDSSFTPDNVDAGRQAAAHLVGRGRRRIALINGEISYDAARDRSQGVSEVLLSKGMELVGGADLYGDWTEQWGRRGTREILAAHPEIDAIVAGSDLIARGVLDAVRDASREIPSDIAVVSFDNWEQVVVGARPQLTSIDMNLEHLGRLAARELFSAIGGQPTPGLRRVPVYLVSRDSVPDVPREPGTAR
ncbi:MAG: LacI family transcriptional regulator [Herbiconiux sp.]|nr:MAG: LacI family transcriptional regulator [Herbiconiux sp.]